MSSPEDCAARDPRAGDGSGTAARRVVVASANPGKLAEIAALLAPCGIEALPQAQFSVAPAEETGLTFVENAIIKARHAAAATGLAAIADDSGLEVKALGGAPGVRSARFAGETATDADNVARLLALLEGEDDRRASFRCVMVYLRNAGDPAPLVAEGVWTGEILREPRGGGGFGYDPVFLAPQENASAAELDAARKNTLSHRGQAVRKLAALLTGARPPG